MSWLPRRGDRRAYLIAAVLIVGAQAVLRLVPVITSGAAAPMLLLIVVIVARAWGTGPAIVASAVGALGYSYYFLPPLGFGIENPNDWVAFIAFTVSAIVVGELAANAERERVEAQAGRVEIERLYQELQTAFDRASEAEAARRNEQLKAALLDALTHNLRTPLTSIKAAVTALIGSDHQFPRVVLPPEGRHELLAVIDEESDRLNRFIGGLSVAGQAETGEPMSVQAVCLDEILRASLARAGSLTRDHRVEVDIDPQMPSLSVDAAAVSEVLHILLDNASKYSPPGTAIRVTGTVEDGRHARIAVVDQGPGIPPALRERVFEKFFRIPGREPSDPRRKGVGLGLPIARRLVEAQAGRLWVESPPSGHGTAVVFTLPLVAGPAAGDPKRVAGAVI